MATGRVLPINLSTGGGGYNAADAYPKAAQQSITMGVRVGNSQYAIGYVQEFTWSMKRDNKVLQQIEPFPNGTFGNSGAFSVDFPAAFYWPGEPVEIVPGKVGGIEITIKRYALYTSNILAAAFRVNEKVTGIATGNIDESTMLAGTADPVNLNGTQPNNYVSLIQQVRPITMYQIYYSPLDGSMIYGREFQECWFTNLGEDSGTADDNHPILDNATMIATRVRPYNKSTIG